MIYALFDIETGKILQTGTMTDPMLLAGPGRGIYLGEVDGSTHYIVGGLQRARPEVAFDRLAIAADGVDAAILTPALAGTTVVLNGNSWHAVAEGEPYRFSTAVPGAHRLGVRPPFPYRRLDAVIIAE